MPHSYNRGNIGCQKGREQQPWTFASVTLDIEPAAPPQTWKTNRPRWVQTS